MPLWYYALYSGLNFGFSLEYFTRREILHTKMLSVEHSCEKKKKKGEVTQSILYVSLKHILFKKGLCNFT